MKEARGKYLKELQSALPDHFAAEGQGRLFADEPSVTTQMNEHQSELDMEQQFFAHVVRLVQDERGCPSAAVLWMNPANVVADPPVGINALSNVIRYVVIQDIDRRVLGNLPGGCLAIDSFLKTRRDH